MKSIKNLGLMVVFLATIISCSNMKNIRTETVKISGNCGMCKNTIETAGNVKKVAQVEWNKDSKMAVLKYDSSATNRDQILKRIALAGYDNQEFRADDKVYAGLPGCCQYSRIPLDNVEIVEENVLEPVVEDVKVEEEVQPTEVATLQKVFAAYFSMKDAFIKSDGKLVSDKAKVLLQEIKAIKMDQLSQAAHVVFMKTMEDLAFHAKHIQDTKDVGHQREHLDALSDAIFENMKVAQLDSPVYYQFCPMANDGKGANWVSKEKVIKNPYFGAQMLSCGSTVETLK